MKRGWNAFAALRMSARRVTIIKLTFQLFYNSCALVQPVDVDKRPVNLIQTTRGRDHVEPTRGREVGKTGTVVR